MTQLTAAAAQVRAVVRNPDVAGLPAVEVLPGDLTLPDTLDESLHGIEAVFLKQVSTIGRAIGRSLSIEELSPEVNGTPARTFFDWASDHAQAFRA